MNINSPKALTLEVAAIVVVVAAALLIVIGWVFFSNNANTAKRPSVPANTPSTAEIPRPQIPAAVPAEIITAIESAVRTTTIDVTKCLPKPVAATFEMGAKVRFVNDDATAHQIFFSPALDFGVPAKGSQAVVFDVWRYPGLRKYSCDGVQGAGSVYITD